MGLEGLLAGLSGGLEGGLEGYQAGLDRKRTRRKDSLDEATQQAGILRSGYQAVEDPTGKFNLVKDPNFRDSDAELKALQLKKLRKEVNPSHEDKISSLKGDDRKRYDSIREARAAMRDMADALSKGTSPYSLVGDNPYTLAQRKWAEELGRMQSGGVINKEENVVFKGFAPGGLDDDKIKQKKIADADAMLRARMVSLGFKPEDIEDFKSPISYTPSKHGGGLLGEAKNLAETTVKGLVPARQGVQTVQAAAPAATAKVGETRVKGGVTYVKTKSGWLPQ